MKLPGSLFRMKIQLINSFGNNSKSAVTFTKLIHMKYNYNKGEKNGIKI